MRERLDLPVPQVPHPLSHSCDRPDNGPADHKRGNQDDQQNLSDDVPERVAPDPRALGFNIGGVVEGGEDSRHFRFAVQRKCVAVHRRLADCLKSTETMILRYALCKQIEGRRNNGCEFRANSHSLSEIIIGSNSGSVFAVCKSLYNKAKLRSSPTLHDSFDRFLQTFAQCFCPPLEIRTEAALLRAHLVLCRNR